MHFNFFKLRIFKTKSKSKLKLTFSSADKEMIFQNKKTGQNKKLTNQVNCFWRNWCPFVFGKFEVCLLDGVEERVHAVVTRGARVPAAIFAARAFKWRWATK